MAGLAGGCGGAGSVAGAGAGIVVDIEEAGREGAATGGVLAPGPASSTGAITGEVVSCFTAWSTPLSKTFTWWDKSGGSRPASVAAGTNVGVSRVLLDFAMPGCCLAMT